MLFGFVALLANLFLMQIVRGGYYRSLSEKNRLRVLYLEGPRGAILDRNGEALATSRLSFNCSVIPREARGTIEASCRAVAPILGEDAETLLSRFQRRKPGAYNTALLAEDISKEQAMAIEEKLDLLPGFLIETRPQREYPLGASASHITGYLGPLNEDEQLFADYYGYKSSDWSGREGLEKYYETYLRGFSGGLQMEVNNRGRFVRALGVKEPKEGKDIRLTVDARLQKGVQGFLGGQKGAVIVMELSEGGILSLNSAPSYDANLFSSAAGRKKVGVYLKDDDAPLINRAVRGTYPPGSIFKIVTAFAALKNKKIRPGGEFQCDGWTSVGGKRFPCWKAEGHGPETLSDGFAHSCNVYFYKTGLLAGVDAIARQAVKMGFGELTGIDLPGEKKGIVPTRDWKRRKKNEAWFDGDTANLSIGQGFLQVSPVQALEMVSAVAAGGESLRPHLIQEIQGVRVGERRGRSVEVSREDLAAVKRGLDAVVNSETGTGRLSRAEGVRIAGKTGTAQSGQDKTHAWFVGYAPEDKPRVALVVFLENGGRGGVNAAKVASKTFELLRDTGYL
jgi:penicillin-binding protein 2